MSEIEKLINGTKEFRKKYFEIDNKLFQELSTFGQNPKIMVVSCSDSRVDPATIFNCQPGQLFVIRNVASLVPPCQIDNAYHGTTAAIEFGTRLLQVEHIIIFGHRHCGGIQALIEDGNYSKNSYTFIAKWMEIARPARDKALQEARDTQEALVLCEHYALINSFNNLRTFPWIEERIKNGSLHIHAWYFDLTTGIIQRYDPNTQTWQPLSE